MQRKYFSNVIAFLGFLSAFSFWGCEVINPEEEVPSYIHIDSIALNTSMNSPHNITDAWVYVNDDLKGVYELPTTFPILLSGENLVQIQPGIELNGIANTRTPYPFFEPFEVNMELVADSVITITPQTEYATNFTWEEDFENVGITIQKTSNSDTAVERISSGSNLFQGNGSGHFTLRENQSTFEAITSDAFELPTGGAFVFLEIHYRCTNTFSVGIFANTGGASVQHTPSLTVNPKDTWNKLYINLTNGVSAYPNAFDYNIYFYMTKDPGNSTADVYIDNIKLIRF